MIAIVDRPSLWLRIRPVLSGFDGPLLLVVLALAALGLLTRARLGMGAVLGLGALAGVLLA